MVVTRARHEAGRLDDALRDLGAEVLLIPTIEIRDPDSWEPLDAAIRRLEQFDFLIATSANGVRKFLGRLAACRRNTGELARLEIGAIGPATAAELTKAGVKVNFAPREYRAEGLIDALSGRDLRGKAFLIPRAKVARDLVPRALEERGAKVQVLEAYQTVAPAYKAGELDRLLSPPPEVVTFTSSSTAANFAKLLGKQRALDVLGSATVASIGPITSQTLRQLGVKVTVEAAPSTIPGLVKALQEFFAVGDRARAK